MLGLCNQITGRLQEAESGFEVAASKFRDGDLLVELATTLADLGELLRQAGRHEDAERRCTEAIAIAGPRGLVPTHAAALATRARVRGDRFSLGEGNLEMARDDAEHAFRLSTLVRRLPWQELQAVEARAELDSIVGEDAGWAGMASRSRAVLIPPGLEPDPPARIEANVDR